MNVQSAIRNLTVPFVLLLLCAIPGCNSLPFPTGINGVALVETSSGNVNPPPPPTISALAGAIITVRPSNGGQEITSIADEHGGFRIEVPPGTYQLVPQVPQDQRFVLAPPEQTVVVVSNKLTQVVLTYNTISHF